jgi:hypothetical protein
MRTLADLKERRPRALSGRLCRIRAGAVALVILVILAPCLLSSREVSASDFHFHIKDDKTGESFFINALTGDYLFFRGAKRNYIAGRGKLMITDCLIELRDSGASAKRPDREVYVVYNLCEGTAKAQGQVYTTGESFTLIDSHTTDDEQIETNARDNRPADRIVAPDSINRFQPVCLQDDMQSYLQFTLLGSFQERAYRFEDRLKDISVKGIGNVVMSGCKITLTDCGETPKRPDRRVIVEYNTCTFEANIFIWIAETGQTYRIHDRDSRNNVNCTFEE